MGVLCMLLDKKRRYSSFLADIFNITGHRLLIALDENEALELFKASKPEVIILPYEDINFWFKLLELEKYLIPVVFVESYEDAESLRMYGLRDINYVVLPFNPMELLTKVININKEAHDETSLSAIGPVNILLKLLRKGATFALVMEDEEGSCTVYVREGAIKGSSCSMEELRTLISKDVKVGLDLYKEDESVVSYAYKNNWDFFSNLVHEHVLEPASQARAEIRAPKLILDLSQPIKVRDGLFWVGVAHKDELLQKNSYLRIYERENIKLPILINVGTMQDYPTIRAKLKQITGTVDAIKAVILLGSSLDEALGLYSLLQSNQSAFVITSFSIAQRLKAVGIPQSRIRAFETFPNKRLKLATGDVLKFIQLPFLPESGSFAVLEEKMGYLFTGRFLSSFCTYEELNPVDGVDLEEPIIYTTFIVPSKDILNNALKKLATERITSILPMFGNPVYSENKVKELLTRLERASLQVVYDMGLILEVCNEVLGYLREYLETSEFQAFLEELSHFAYIEESKILELFIEAESLPILMLSLMYAKGIKPALIKHTIKQFHKAGIPLTI